MFCEWHKNPIFCSGTKLFSGGFIKLNKLLACISMTLKHFLSKHQCKSRISSNIAQQAVQSDSSITLYTLNCFKNSKWEQNNVYIFKFFLFLRKSSDFQNHNVYNRILLTMATTSLLLFLFLNLQKEYWCKYLLAHFHFSHIRMCFII